MATIIEGKQYALKSSLELNKNHSIVFVKLTDSALKAIEDYALAISKGNVSQNNNIKKPLIELQTNTSSNGNNGNTQGIITLPNLNNENDYLSTSDNSNNDQHFNFTIKDIQNEGTSGGILECVRQKSMSIESLGKIMLRMQIHANDDVYQKTKVKMAVAVEQENKKYNTKVIEFNNNNRKLKQKKPYTKFNGNSINGNSNGINSNNVNNNGISSTNIRFNKYQTNNNNNSVQSSLKLIPSEHLRKVRELLIQLLVTKSCNKPLDIIPKVQERFKELPIDRQQIIQILNTIATFKEGQYHINELAVAEEALQQFEMEKRNNNNSMTNVSITVNNSGINGHNNNINNSLSPYSDHSAKSLSSPNSLNTSPSTTVTGSANNKLKYSPYTNGTSNNNKQSMKRNNIGQQDYSSSSSLTTSNQSQKKFKSDNNSGGNLRPSSVLKSNSAINSITASAGSNYSPFDKINQQQSEQSEHSPMRQQQHNSYSKSISNGGNPQYDSVMKQTSSSMIKETNHNHSNNQHNNRNYSSNTSAGSMHSTPNSSPDSDIISHNLNSGINGVGGSGGSHSGGTTNGIGSESSQNNDSDDYISKYPRIKDYNQLLQYRRDFESEYPEYIKLYDYVENIAKQFEDLKERIQSKEEESEEWHDLIRQIFDKYDEVKNRSKYQRSQKRLLYLHYKLLHIKNQITEYYRNNNGDIPDNNNKLQTSSQQSIKLS